MARLPKTAQSHRRAWLQIGCRCRSGFASFCQCCGEMYAQALEATDYQEGTLKNAKYVASRVERSLRNDNLRWYHHYAVAPLEPADQKMSGRPFL